jgi:hypothetical protein
MDENKKVDTGNFYLTLKIAVFETKPFQDIATISLLNINN